MARRTTPRTAEIAAVASVLALVLLVFLMFVASEAITADEIPSTVSAGALELGRLGEADALEVLNTYEVELTNLDITYRLGAEAFTVSGTDIGLDIDGDGIVSSAFALRRQGGVLSRFTRWLTSFREAHEIPLLVTYDETKMTQLLKRWEAQAIKSPPFEGGLVLQNGRIQPDYPRDGEQIDQEAALTATHQMIQSRERKPIALHTVVSHPTLTESDFDTAAERANRIVDSAIVLRSDDPEAEITFTPEVLAAALTTEVILNEGARIKLGFDPNVLAAVVHPYRDQIEAAPRDAQFSVDNEDNVTLIPSRAQILLDIDLFGQRLLDIADRGGTTGTLPYASGVQAEFTTQDAEAMGEITKVSEATTNHSCCQHRVKNIQNMAKAVADAVVRPGETFDLNEHVGRRTLEKGYLPAPMILRGEIVDDVGGGVSQFATTLYGAIFYGCYEDVAHKPHSYYFSRYPEGIEATVSWGGPELIFRNDTAANLIIKTSWTDTSITVKFFGNTGGRRCEGAISDRYDHTDPPKRYQGDDTLAPGTETQVEEGTQGWTIDIYRYVHYEDGTMETQEWSHPYSPRPTMIGVHPCDLETATDPCPVMVPDVIDTQVESATSLLQDAGFEVVVDPVKTTTASADGQTTSQSPSAGSYHPMGTAITITVQQYVAPTEE